MRVVSMKKRGSPFVCRGLAFTARSLAQTWPTILIGFWGLAQWLAPRYERQTAQHNSTSSGTISFSGSWAKAPILHPFWWLFSIKIDSRLWHKGYQAYYSMVTVNGKNETFCLLFEINLPLWCQVVEHLSDNACYLLLASCSQELQSWAGHSNTTSDPKCL